MEKELIIRPALVGDAVLIAHLASKTFMETYGEMNTPENMEKYLETQFSVSKIIAELSNHNARFFLVYVDGIPAAFTKLRQDRKPKQLENEIVIEIQRIYVLKEFQGFSIGKTLIKMVKKLAKAEGFKAIWLQVWQKNNKAIRFYQKVGFVVYETATFILGDDVQQDFLMRYDLLY
jgi:ribosomal protein S18 acetylase RimI-like enzyme